MIQQTRTGYFGDYGGMYVPEIIIPALIQLEDQYNSVKNDAAF